MSNLYIKDEVWRDIPGYNEYQISNYGRVKSLVKNKPQILAKSISQGKYKVNLYYKTGRCRNELVGRIVCSVFHRMPEENEVIGYLDGNKLNDHAENVFWMTKSESVRNAKNRNRYASHGVLNGMAKLSPEKVIQIRNYKSQGKTSAWIGAQFGVSRQVIDKAIKRATWKEV